MRYRCAFFPNEETLLHLNLLQIIKSITLILFKNCETF